MTKAKSRGRITPSFVIRCGALFCDRATTAWVPTMEAAALEFVSRGWAESAVGRVCPECSPKIAADPAVLIPDLKNLHRMQLTRLRMEYGAGVAAAKTNGSASALFEAMVLLRAVEDELRVRNFDRAEFTNSS